MSISSTRSLLYTLARLLGDVNAVKKGKVGKRVGRRLVGKATGRGLRRPWRRNHGQRHRRNSEHGPHGTSTRQKS